MASTTFGPAAIVCSTLTGLVAFRDRLADRLSGGMKQKLALACTLVHEPPLLVLDEPTTGVDPVSRREFWKLLAEFLAGGLTIVLATPYLDEAERCRRVLLLNEGRQLALDEPSKLQAAFPGVVFEVVVPAPRRALDALGATFGTDRVQLFGDRLHAHMDTAARQRDLVNELDRAGLAPVARAADYAGPRGRVHRIHEGQQGHEGGVVRRRRSAAGGSGRMRTGTRYGRSSVHGTREHAMRTITTTAGLVVALAAGLVRPALGQEPLVLTVEEAVARAVAEAPRLAEARAREAAADAAVASRASLGRPIVTASTGFMRTNHVDEFGVAQAGGGVQILFPDIPNNYRARAEVAVPLFTAGRAGALVAAAEADRRAVAADRRTTSADVTLQVVSDPTGRW